MSNLSSAKKDWLNRVENDPDFRAALKGKMAPNDMVPIEVSNPPPETLATQERLRERFEAEFGRKAH